MEYLAATEPENSLPGEDQIKAKKSDMNETNNVAPCLYDL